MANRKYEEAQIHKILKEAEAGTAVKELCQKYGMTEQTFYKWKVIYSGMELSDMKKLRSLENENSKLKRIIADQALEMHAMKMVIEKKF